MRVSVLVAIAIVGVSFVPSAVGAQSWTSPRGRPPLWQIIALDRSGETGWPYGAEDIAGDGANKFEADEASADLRSVYADADRNRVWIRAYVAATGNVSADLSMFFFIDSDERSDTGGGADATDLRPEFDKDPSAGGYERAFGVRADGMLIGAWRWDAGGMRWMATNPVANSVQIEIDHDQDPLRLAGNDHAYAQIAIEHSLTGLNQSCNGRIFVRSWLDDPPQRSFGDEVLGAAPCRPKLDGLGDPAILRVGSCAADKECPAGGRCREQICVFEYACGTDVDCRSGERCTGSVCVKVVSGACDDDADCDGLVCEAGACVACSDNGSRACASGLACTPNGTCADPADAAAGGSAGSGDEGGGGSGAADYPPGQVRGGSFHCAAVSGERVSASWLYAGPLLALWLRRRRRGWSS